MKSISILSFLVISICSLAQTGGTSTFALMDLTYNARSAGLGNDFISVKDQDINLGVSNPSLYNAKMQANLSLSQALLAGGINYGQVAYGRKIFNGFGAGSIRYVNYGEFKRTNVNGTEEGTFNPFECIIGAGYGKQLNPRISVGVNVNMIFSQLETYNAFGAAIDLAGAYTSKDDNLLVTALVKNAGYQFNGYSKKQHDALPAEFQMAMSYKLKHAPFRFSLLAHHLNNWNISYVDPNLTPTVDQLTGDTIPVKYAGFGEILARHFTYQLEVIASKNIHLRTGFDYQRRQEMKLSQRPGIAGLSFGIGFYFNKVSIDYGFSIYSISGFNNMLTLSTDLSKWKK